MNLHKLLVWLLPIQFFNELISKNQSKLTYSFWLILVSKKYHENPWINY